MAIALFGTQGATYPTASPVTFGSVVNHNSGDLLLLYVLVKPDTAIPTTPSNYTLVASATGGAGTTGVDTGPMGLYVYARVATAGGTTGDLPSSSTITGINVAGWATQAFTKAAGMAWEVAGVAAADTTTGTPHSVTMPSNPGLTAGDYLVAIGAIPTDVTTPSQFSAETVSATGMTTVTLSESLEFDTTGGNDLGGWLAVGPVVTGTATAAPTVSATAAATNTNVAGPIALIRLREVTLTSKSGSDSGTHSVTESASVSVIQTPFLRDVKTSTTARGSATTNQITGLSVATGDVIVVKTGVEDSSSPVTGVSGGGLTWTKQAGSTVAARCDAQIWTAIATATTTINITVTNTNGGTHTKTATAESWGDAQLAATPATVAHTTGGSAPSASLTTTAANSIISWTSQDYNAISPTGRTYRDGPTEEAVVGTPGTDFTAYFAYQPAYSAGSNTFGLTAPTGQLPTMAGIEVQYQASATTPVSASDTGTHSAIEDAALSILLPTSDTGTHSATETAAVTVIVSTSDTGTHSATDTSGNALTLSRADAGTHSATDISANALFLTTTDTGTHSATDASTPAVIIATADSGTHSATDASTLSIAGSINDTGTHSATEAIVVSGSSSRSDTGTHSATESAAIAVVVSASDSGTHSATDSSAVAVPYLELPASDTGTHSATESAAVLVTIVTTDSGTHSATDTSTMFKAITASDSGTHSATDSSGMALTYSISDSGTHSATESASLFINDAKDLSENPVHSVTESVSIVGTATASDTGTHSATESATIFKMINVSDSGTHSATETSFVFNDRPAADSGIHSATEDASVQISGLVTKSTSDTGTHSAAETSAVASTSSVSDSGTHSATEELSGNSSANYSDSAVHSATESASISVSESASDTGTHSATESASVEIFVGTQVMIWTGTAFESSVMYRWDGSAFVPVTMYRWNGTGFELV